jgi:cation diffusion facilitator CzcD-associated flavoprotein CzcO
MPKLTAPRIAIVGAGPIGLEAGLAARQLKWPFTIFEQGRVGEHVWRWGHVKLFSPFGMNATALGRQAILSAKPEYAFPADAACTSGREHVERYLVPLADVMRDRIRTETRVLGIGRVGFFKNEASGDAARARAPFLLLVREKNLDRFEEADVVLDCTGTYGQHRWLGPGGIPALGELQAENQIAYHLVDILGEAKKDYLNKAVLVIGSGYSAATAVTSLARLGEEHNTTWTTWIARAPHTQPLRRIVNDSLRERDRLTTLANGLATRTDANVEFRAGTSVEAIETLPNNQGFRVSLRTAGPKKTLEVEKIIASVGYLPDRSICRELQVYEEAPAAGRPASVRQAEPNYFVLGAKSHGRNSQFLLQQGFDQVREVFALLKG